MKILNSLPISSFGGLNFVINELNRQGISDLLNNHLPDLPVQSTYSWKDILFSFWSIIFCGGDCAEDISINLKTSLLNNPLFKLPSPDRILDRMKELAETPMKFDTLQGKSIHTFSFNRSLNKLNIKVLKKLGQLKRQNNILDYDNTLIYANKADAAYTYKKKPGYCPGVGLIGSNIVYIENRNGNSDAQTLQHDTLTRMFNLLDTEKIEVDAFRGDSASDTFLTVQVINQRAKQFYIRKRMCVNLAEAINQIDKWEKVIIDNEILYRGSIKYTPYKYAAKRVKQEHLLKEFRLVVTKEKRRDGQISLFTGEACNYSAILTNDYKKSNDEIVFFYNQRGASEKEFDILKNDFAWNKIPFSEIQSNTVFLLITAMCKNIYNYIINEFSKRFKNLSPKYRLKKFIFRFICIPGKWIKTGRTMKLRIYGDINFKT